MTQRRPKVGDVVQIGLPSGRYAYGRVVKDASVAFYSITTDAPRQPPIGSRDFAFVVGVYDDVLRSGAWPVVGHDPSRDPSDDWPPANSVRDPLNGSAQIYERGAVRPASEAEIQGLEPAAVWDAHHIVDRLEPPIGESDRRRRS